jgi:undecaprenyl-diphosphatase
VAVLGVVLNDYVEKYLHSPLLIAFDLIFFGIILWLVDKYSEKSNKLSAIGYKRSFWIGISQAIALFPGVSRSGITMTAGRLGGLTKKDAARFAFLLATPAMLGAFVFKMKDMALSTVDLPFAVGVISSALFGFLAIKFLLKYLERGSFTVFVWYRIIIAAIVLFIYFK